MVRISILDTKKYEKTRELLGGFLRRFRGLS